MKKWITATLILVCVTVGSLQAALTWTGADDAVSLYKEGNWLDNTGAVPAAGTIDPGKVLTADTGGLVEIVSGAGTPGNFNGDFKLAAGDDLTVKNGKVLKGNDDLVGGGAGSVLTLTGSGTELNVNRVLAFDSITVSNAAVIILKSGFGIDLQQSSSVMTIADGSSVSAQFVSTGDRVVVDGSSSLTLSGTDTPINNIEVHLEIGGQLTLPDLAEFAEQGAKIFVDGVSFSADNSILSFSGSDPVTATALSASTPYIGSFSSNPESFTIEGDVELSWITLSSGRLEISDGTGLVAIYTASANGQAFLDSGCLVISNLSTTTTYTLSATFEEDGSGVPATTQTTVTVIVPTAATDTDGDGLPDLDEVNIYSTNPNLRDTDHDGTPDGLEIAKGLDPNNPDEFLDRPNILFIIVDDLGYGDLGCFWQDQQSGTQKFDTPHIDTLAAAGAKMTHHYVAAAVCVPSRASFLQGRNQGHADVRDNQFDKALPDNHGIADMLRRAGYRTIHIGKNGLAGAEASVNLSGTGSQDLEGHPLHRGFDEFFGYLFHQDGHEHFPRNGSTDKTAHIYDGYRQVKDASLDLYTTDAWTAYAKKAITEEVQDGDHQPFFMYLAYDTPHFKMQRPAVAYPAGGGLTGGIQWTTDTDGFGNVRYASTADGTGSVDGYNHPENDPSWPTSAKQHVGMIRRIDNGVGDIMQLLTDLGIDDNTLVVFTSDNGPHDAGNNPRYFGSFANLEGIKRDLLEGGIRVPTVIHWPGHVAGATGSETNVYEMAFPSALWDWMPTFAEMAEVPAPAWCNGVSLLPTITGEGNQREEKNLYFEYYHNSSTPSWPSYFPSHAGESRMQMQAVRVGDYMGVRTGISGATDNFQIYNVVTDPAEATNLAASMPELQQQLKDIALQSRRVDSSASRPYDSANVPAAPRSVVSGLDYRCYEGIWSYVPEFRDLPAKQSGKIAAVDLAVRSRDDHVGILFSGYIDVPTTGSYTFYLQSDSGADFFMHNAHVIADDYNHDGSERSGDILLAAGLHPFRLYYRHGKAETYQLDLSWAGPGLTKEAVPASAFFSPPELFLKTDFQSGTGLQLSWNSSTGQIYRIKSSDTLTVPVSYWSNMVEGIDTTPPTNTVTVPATVDSQRFFVIEEE